MNSCLTHYKHRVMLASGGKQGLELFRTATLENQPYEVVITDFGMPDIDGRRVARTIKAESPNTPIIMMTGWGCDDEGRGRNRTGSRCRGQQTAAHGGTERLAAADGRAGRVLHLNPRLVARHFAPIRY